MEYSSVLKELLSAKDASELVDTILKVYLEHFSLTVFFKKEGNKLKPWRARGVINQDRLKEVEIPLDLPSVFKNAIENRTHFYGTIPGDDRITKDIFKKKLMLDPPSNLLIIPISLNDKLIGVLYGDRRKEHIHLEEISDLLIISYQVPEAFRELILRKKSGKELEDDGITVEVEEQVIDQKELRKLVEELNSRLPYEVGDIIKKIKKIGRAAIPVIMEYFPGNVVVNRNIPTEDMPPVEFHSSIIRCLVAMGEEVLPYVMYFLNSQDRDKRFYATFICANFLRQDLIHHLYKKLLDEDSATRDIAVAAMKRYENSKEFASVLTYLQEALKSEDRITRQKSARIMGMLGMKKFVPMLIPLLDDREWIVREVAHMSLVMITKHDVGESARKWRSWWKHNADKERIQWLINGLNSNDDTIRLSAFLELYRIVGDDMGYYYDYPEGERQRAIARFRDWYEQNQGADRAPQ